MIRVVRLTLFVIAMMTLWPAKAGVTVTDARGKSLTLESPARRIISLAPHLTELAYAAGAGKYVVGAVAFSDYPAAAQRLPRVGDATRLDYEAIVSLRPDLVLAWQTGNRAADIERLEKLGFPVFVSEPARLADIPILLRQIGTLSETSAQAHEAAMKFTTRWKQLGQRYGGMPRVRVFYQIWHDPLMTINGRHMIDDVIRLCGGVNIFSRAQALTPVVSIEEVLARRPRVILASEDEGNRLDFWKRFVELPAVRDHAMFRIPPHLIHRQTPRILEGARQVCEDLQTARTSAGFQE